MFQRHVNQRTEEYVRACLNDGVDSVAYSPENPEQRRLFTSNA